MGQNIVRKDELTQKNNEQGEDYLQRETRKDELAVIGSKYTVQHGGWNAILVKMIFLLYR